MKLKQLLIEIKEEDHRYIKKCAAELGMPMKRFIVKAVAAYMVEYTKRIKKGYNEG